MKIDPFSKALNYAYKLLSIRERSEKEIRVRLKEKGYSKECTDSVVERLKQKKLLDDAQFVRAWIEDRSTFRPKGALAIRNELRKKGVDEGVIDEALNDVKVGYNEYELAKALVDKKFGSRKELSGIKRKKSIYNYLARRGFSFDIINDIISRL